MSYSIVNSFISMLTSLLHRKMKGINKSWYSLFFLSIAVLLLPIIARSQGWTPQNSGTTAFLSRITFTDVNNGWASGDSGIVVHTTNSGVNWMRQTSGSMNSLNGVAFSNSNSGWVVGASGTVIHTTNSGTNWISQTSYTTNSLQGVACTDSNNCWAVGYNGTIIHTSNGGTNWVTQNSNTTHLLQSVAFSDNNNGYAVGALGTILHTTNSGSIWVILTSDTTFEYDGVAVFGTSNVWAVGQSGTITHSSNGGTTWSRQASGTTERLVGVSFTDFNHGWAVGDNGTIICTTNGGTNWTSQASGTTNTFHGVAFPNINNGWVSGQNGTIKHYFFPLKITRHNGGEYSIIGIPDTISWSQSGITGNVTISLNTNYPSTNWITLGTALASQGFYMWTPTTAQISNTARICVTSVSNPAIGDTSDANFTINDPALTINQGLTAFYPFNGDTNDYSGNGIIFSGGSATPAVDRYGNSYSAYSFNGSQSLSTPNTNNFSFIPGTISAWIKVLSNSFGTIISINSGGQPLYAFYELTNGSDSIAGRLWYRSQSLSGSDSYYSNSQIPLNTWTHVAITYDYEYFRFYINGVLDAAMPSTRVMQDFTMHFLIVGNHQVSNRYFNGTLDEIRIYSRPLVATEINQLYLNTGLALTRPNSGETFYTNTTDTIRWSGNGITGNVRIELNTNYPSTNWTTLGTAPASQGYFRWIPTSNELTTTARIRVSSIGYPLICDTSNVNFTIQGIQLTSPSGGEYFTIGTTDSIRWTSVGITGNVSISLNRNNPTGTWETIAASVANTGSYAWTVTGTPSANAKIRISSVSNPAIMDTSAQPFFILYPNATDLHWSAPTLTVSCDRIAANSAGYQFVTGQDAHLYRSTNNGATWSQTTLTFANQSNGLRCSPNGSVFVGTTASGVYRSTDNGATFTQANTGIADLDVKDFAFSPTGSFAFASTYVGLSRSSNNGTNWSTCNENFIHAVAASPNGMVWIAQGDTNNVYRSTDNGTTWILATTGLNGAPVISFAFTSNAIFAGTSDGRVFVTTNEETSWTPVLNAPGAQFQAAIGLSTNKVYFGDWCGSGIYRTSDNGVTWLAADSGLTNLYVFGLAKSSDGYLLESHNYGVQKSDAVQDNFILISHPNGGESLITGQPDTIRWTSAGFTGNVNIELNTTFPSAIWTTFFSNIANTGTQVWTPTSGQISTTARLRITSVSMPSIRDTSNANFSIITMQSFPLGNSGSNIDMVWIPPGSFTMGSPTSDLESHSYERPQHTVNIGTGFWLSKTELTQAQWRLIMHNNPSGFNGDSLPVEQVSWTDVHLFVDSINAQNGYGAWRLPTDAEWEYAARAGTTTRFPWGDDNSYAQLGEYAWYRNNSSNISHPVATKLPNPWGLYDMTGNVFEWVEDYWHTDYTGAPNDGSAWLSNPADTNRVTRGGSWYEIPQYCRSGNRDPFSPNRRYNGQGLRLARFAQVLTLSHPSGGETYRTNTVDTIRWTSVGFTGNVRLDLNRTYPTGTWETIAASTANTGSFPWTVTGTTSNLARMRITSLSDTTITNTSSRNFVIQSGGYNIDTSTVALWRFNEGFDSLTYDATGNNHNLTMQDSARWSDTDSRWGRSINLTASSAKLTSSDTIGNSWNALCIESYIKPTTYPTGANAVIAARSNFYNDESFSLELTPTGAIYGLIMNSTGLLDTIRSTSTPLTLNQWHQVALSWSSGNSLRLLVDSIIVAESSAFTGPLRRTTRGLTMGWSNRAAGNMRFTGYIDETRISNADRFLRPSLSLVYPNGGEYIVRSSQDTIRWNYSALTGNVSVIYRPNYPSTFPSTNLGTAPIERKWLAWSTPSSLTSNARIIITSQANPAFGDTSNSNFSVVDRFLTVNKPNGGERFAVGLPDTIRWYSSFPCTVGVALNRHGIHNLGDIDVIELDIPSLVGLNQIVWTPTSPATDSALVYILDMSTTSTGTEVWSANNFRIVNSFVNVTKPNGQGTWWYIGLEDTIKWDSYNVHDSLRVLFRPGYTGNWSTLYSNIPDTHAVLWTLADSLLGYSDGKIKVQLMHNSTIFDTSDYQFNIAFWPWNQGYPFGRRNSHGHHSVSSWLPSIPYDNTLRNRSAIQISFPTQTEGYYNPDSISASYAVFTGPTDSPTNAVNRIWTISAFESNFQNATLTLRFTRADMPSQISPRGSYPPFSTYNRPSNGSNWIYIPSGGASVDGITASGDTIYLVVVPNVNHCSDWMFSNAGIQPQIVGVDSMKMFRVGTTDTIRWTSNHWGGALSFLINRTYPGGTWDTLRTNVANDSGSGYITWAVNAPITTSARIRVVSNLFATDGDTSVPVRIGASNPRAPQNPVVQFVNPSVQLRWSPVVNDTFGNPLTGINYRIEWKGILPFDTTGNWQILGNTADTVFFDSNVANTRKARIYYIKAISSSSSSSDALPVKRSLRLPANRK